MIATQGKPDMLLCSGDAEKLPTCEVVVASLGTGRGQVLVLAAAGDHLTILQSTCHTGHEEQQCMTAVTGPAKQN